jgi:hypothetical protein
MFSLIQKKKKEMGFEELGCPDTRVATAITTRTMERIIVLKYCVG